jgi:hypothetical protein
MLPNEGEGLGLRESLSDYETQRLSIEAGFRRSFFNTLSGPFLRARLRRKMMRNIKAEIGLTKGNLVDGQASLERFRTDLNRYFRATAKAEAYTLYERLFAAWHLLHFPLFAILVLAEIVHVLAVHLY